MIGEQLWIERGDGAAKAHRCILAGRARLDTVAGKRRRVVPIQIVESRARRDVPASELAPATPLTAAEEREYDRLDAALAGTFGEADLLRKFNALRLRSLMFGSVS